MTRIFGSPTRYVQGYDEIKNLGKYVKPYAKKVLVIIDEFLYPTLKESLTKEGLKGFDCVFEKMNYGVTYANAERVKEIALKEKVEMVIAIGGGRTMDVGRAIAHLAGDLPVGIVPTAASVDAPVISLSVMYKDNGDFLEYLIYQRSAAFILVDSKIIANAPVRLLVSGFGDALGTYFETRSTIQANGKNMLGAKATKTGAAVAALCYETLLESGYRAKLAVEKKVVTQDVEDVIEANTLMSGIGVESCGLAAAHAFYNAAHSFKKFHKFMHGEIVSFGCVIQLFLEGKSTEEIDELLDFCLSVGLPISLVDYDFDEVNNKDELMQLCINACQPTETMVNVPFKVEPQFLFDTIVGASAYCEAYKKCNC